MEKKQWTVSQVFTRKISTQKFLTQSKILSNSVIYRDIIIHIMVNTLRKQFTQTAKNNVTSSASFSFSFICAGFEIST